MTTCECLDNGVLGSSLRERSLKLVLEHEWCADGMCPECGERGPMPTSIAPAHTPKHEDDCEWGAICAAYRRGPLTHYADDETEECETTCEQTKARDIITNTRADVTCADCKERNGIKP